MISFPDILFILLIHWLADFALQTHEQAINKSKSGEFLFFHVSTYSIVWAIASYFIFKDFPKCCIFVGITFTLHYLTDFITSRIGKSFWDKEDYHNGFVVVGFDQILHYAQLFLCYIWLK